MVATKSIRELVKESHGSICEQDLEKISEEVRTAAYKIIEAKNATYYGIGWRSHELRRLFWAMKTA